MTYLLMTTLLMIKRTVLSNIKMTVRYPIAANLRGLDNTAVPSVSLKFSSSDISHEMPMIMFAHTKT